MQKESQIRVLQLPHKRERDVAAPATGETSHHRQSGELCSFTSAGQQEQS